MKTTRTLHTVFAFLIALASVVACGGEPPATSPAQPPPAAPATPLVEKIQIADWCAEHGVPESICTRCNAGLIDSFKKNGDWCAAHDLPDSQCIPCHPELQAKFAAMAPTGKR